MGGITILLMTETLRTHLNACFERTCDMNKYVIGIFGILLLTLCGTKFNMDSDMLLLVVVGFGLIVLASDSKKKG